MATFFPKATTRWLVGNWVFGRNCCILKHERKFQGLKPLAGIWRLFNGFLQMACLLMPKEYGWMTKGLTTRPDLSKSEQLALGKNTCSKIMVRVLKRALWRNVKKHRFDPFVTTHYLSLQKYLLWEGIPTPKHLPQNHGNWQTCMEQVSVWQGTGAILEAQSLAWRGCFIPGVQLRERQGTLTLRFFFRKIWTICKTQRLQVP